MRHCKLLAALGTMGRELLFRPFKELFAIPLRNGLTKPKAVRGTGTKMINMGEIFAHPRIGSIDMERVPLNEGESQRYILEPGDLLFARQSLVFTGAGKCSIFLGDTEPVTFEGHLIRVRLNQSVASPFFYYYFFNSSTGRQVIEGIIEQVAAAGIRGSDLSQLSVPYFSLPIQRRIAHILGTLDDKIEQARRMNATLEAIARALFRSWFVDFDPVRAKADGRDPPGMDAATAALFPAAFEDSPLGKVPRGWRVGTVGDTISLSKDSLVPGDFPNEIFEHYSIPSFDEGRIPKQSKGEEIKSSKFIVTHQSVLLSRINPDRSRVWLPLENKERRSICSTEYLVVIPKKHTTKEYLYSLFCSRSFQEIFITMVTGTSSSHQRVKAEYFLSMEILEPPKAIIHAYTKIVTPMFERIAANLHHTRTLAALRDALLPKLLSGEVGVGGESA